MNVAVLGLGSAGSRHARNLLVLGHDVVAFDPGSVASPENVARAGSLESAIESTEVVIVASPNSLHAAQAVAALEAGRHVLVEKPLATTVGDAERIVEAAALAQVTCGVAMNLRFHAGVLGLRNLLETNALGTPMLAQASFGYDLRRWHPASDYRQSYSARAELGGGIVFDAIHELDYLLWLLGPILSVAGEAGHVSELGVDVEDTAVATVRFASGALGTIDVNFVEPAYRRTCLIVGSRAVARWDWRSSSITVSREGADDSVIDTRCDVSETYRAELVDFFAALNAGRPPATPADDGLAAVRLADGIKRSAALGRRVMLDRD